MGDYDRLTGPRLDRVWGLSDNVFAFAMTLLVLGVTVPDPARIHSGPGLVAALLKIWPKFLTYLLSFLTLGVYWVAQQKQHGLMARTDNRAAWLHLAFLAAVAMTPFSTALLAAYFDYRAALIAYWLNLTFMGATLHGAFEYELRAGLLKPEVTEDVVKAVRRRLMASQTFYVLAAALSFVNSTWSAGFLLLVQLNYAVSPPIAWLRRLTT
jgi:uncharacterized membrane protein